MRSFELADNFRQRNGAAIKESLPQLKAHFAKRFVALDRLNTFSQRFDPKAIHQVRK